MERVFFTRPDRTRSIPAWAHFPPRFSWQNAEELQNNLTRIHNYFKQTLPWHLPDRLKHHFRVMRETCKLFSRESTKPGELTHRKLNNQILTFLWRIGNQEQARSVADQFASSVVSTRRHLVTLVVAKLRQGELEPRSYRVEMTNGTGNFRNFQNFQRKGQPQEVDRNTFETNFRKLSVPFYFEPELPKILVEWNAPFLSLAFHVSFSSMDTRHQLSGTSSVSFGEWLSERKLSKTAVGLEEGVWLSTGRRSSLKGSFKSSFRFIYYSLLQGRQCIRCK